MMQQTFPAVGNRRPGELIADSVLKEISEVYALSACDVGEYQTIRIFGIMCITEADAGSDVSSIAASAVRDGDDYILNGTKLFVSNGSIADYYIVFASTDKSKGAKGISAFLVDGTSKGLTRGRQEKKLGVHSGDTCEVSFRDVRVPAGNLLGKENEGFKLTMETLDRGRVKVAAMKDYPAEKLMRDAKVFSIFEGTNQINLMVSSGILEKIK